MRRATAGLATLLVALGAGALAPAPSPAGAATPPPYTQPAYAGDFPDPFVLRTGSGFRAYATSGPLGRVQMLTSADLGSWQAAGDALPTPPSWADVGTGALDGVWAPAVVDRAGSLVLYASVLRKGSSYRCIMQATAASPAGPFTDTSGAPFFCDDARHGAIDPSVFVASDGTPWLLWKTEGVPGSEAPTIWSAKLSGDGRTATTLPVALVRADEPWEFPLVENPAMIEDTAAGRVVLTYSARQWDSASYATGYASCAGPAGPCVKPPNRPLMESEGSMAGPGAAELFRDANGTAWMAFQAWDAARVGYGAGGRRTLHLRQVRLERGRPLLAAPDATFPVPPRAARVAGADRYATAAGFSASTVPPFAPVVYVATGESFPDALAGGAAAGSEGSPVLLVTRDALPEATAAELGRLRPGHITVLGGPAAVSDALYDRLAGYSNNSIHREPGADRFDTAARVSANAFRTGAPVAYVATGEGFADALAAGAAGAAQRGPVLLVTRDAVPAATDRELRRLAPSRIVVLGGDAAVSAGVEASLRSYGKPVWRIAGADRYETAAALALAEFGPLVGGTVVATGASFADAVAAGAAGYPVLLVPPGDTAPAGVRDALSRLDPLGVLVTGGTRAVSDAEAASLGL